MWKQRDMCQAKEYGKTPEKALVKQITNLYDKEFKAIVTKILTELGDKNRQTQWELQQRIRKYKK